MYIVCKFSRSFEYSYEIYVKNNFLIILYMFKYSKSGVSVFVVLDRRRTKKSGLFPVKVEVVCNRKQKYYLTGQDLSEEDWAHFPRIQDHVAVEEIENRFYQVRSEVEVLMRNGGFSFPALDWRLGGGRQRTVNSMLEKMMSDLMEEGRINSYYRCRSTLKNLERYGGSDIRLTDVTPYWLKDCERTWVKEGKSLTTVSIYMKTLKSIMNQALRDGTVRRQTFPFGQGRYMVPSGAGRKLALSRCDIRRIISYRGDARLEESRDLWLFSYLCNGINFRDMLYLKYENVVGDEIWFVRAKTSRSSAGSRYIKAVFTPEMRRIVDRWGNRYDGNPDTYLFRYAGDGDDVFVTASVVRKVIARCNRAFARISAETGVPRFTTYSARHSFASVLKWSGADISFISESLGHSSLAMTENYLAGSGHEERVRKSRLLTEKLF